MTQYETVGQITVGVGVALLRSERKMFRFRGHSVQVCMSSLRLHLFSTPNGTTCAKCGLEGHHFLICKNNQHPGVPYHLQLVSKNGVLFTKDHIIPKSHGGADCLENFQTMCTRCNAEKGDSLRDTPLILGKIPIGQVLMWLSSKKKYIIYRGSRMVFARPYAFFKCSRCGEQGAYFLVVYGITSKGFTGYRLVLCTAAGVRVNDGICEKCAVNHS